MVAVRVVLSVALTVAIVSAAAPAIEDARIDRTEGEITADIDEFATTAGHLARTAPAGTVGLPTARRFAEIHVPAPRPGQAALVAFVIGGPLDGHAPADDDSRDLVAYQVRGGPPRRVWLGVDLRISRRDEVGSGDLSEDDDALHIGAAGVHRLALRPVTLGDHVVIVVERVGA